jgi:hypothetical protein
MPFRLSRRRWVLLMGSAPLLAQTTTTAPAPEQRSEKAKTDVEQVSQKLAAVEVPMNIEPSFRFTA